MKALQKETADLQALIRATGETEVLFTKKRGWVYLTIKNESFGYFRNDSINLKGDKSTGYSIKQKSSQTDQLSWEEVLHIFKEWLAKLS